VQRSFVRPFASSIFKGHSAQWKPYSLASRAQRLHLMQPTSRSPEWSISIRGRWQWGQVWFNAVTGDGCSFPLPREAAQARFTRLRMTKPKLSLSAPVVARHCWLRVQNQRRYAAGGKGEREGNKHYQSHHGNPHSQG
jgi:hypothetical protein